MTKTRLLIGSAVLLLVLGTVLSACGGAKEPAPGEAPADLDGKALIEERCTVCHNLQTVTSASKSREGWVSNVERMIGKGAQLNDAEKEAVVDYLAEAYP
jgi:hypothetical protein